MMHKPEAEYYLVWGQYYKEQMDKFETPTQVLVAGYPFFQDAVRDVQNYSNGNGAEVLVLPSPYSRRHLLSFTNIIAASVSAYSNLKCVIKMHPSEPAENVGFYEDIFSKYGVSCSVLRSGNLSQLMCQSKIIIQSQSTTALEGLMREKVVVEIPLPEEDNFDSSWTEGGAILKADSVESLSRYIEKVVVKPDATFMSQVADRRKQFCETFFSSESIKPECVNDVWVKAIKNIVSEKHI